MAPTGSGKTAVALIAILQAFRRGKRAVYTSPIKALSNQKYAEFTAWFASRSLDAGVTLLTGDIKIRASPDCQHELIICTSEILRNKLVKPAPPKDAPGAPTINGGDKSAGLTATAPGSADGGGAGEGGTPPKYDGLQAPRAGIDPNPPPPAPSTAHGPATFPIFAPASLRPCRSGHGPRQPGLCCLRRDSLHQRRRARHRLGGDPHALAALGAARRALCHAARAGKLPPLDLARARPPWSHRPPHRPPRTAARWLLAPRHRLATFS